MFSVMVVFALSLDAIVRLYSVIVNTPVLLLYYFFLCSSVRLTFSPLLYFPVSILRKSISGRHRPVRVADGPMTARCRFT